MSRAASLALMALSLLFFAPSAAANKERGRVVVLDGGVGSVGTPRRLGEDRAFLSGYVVEDRGFTEPGRGDGALRNTVRNLRAATAKPVADVEVDVDVGERTYRTRTDASGRFHLELEAAHIRDLGHGNHEAVARVPGQVRPELSRAGLHLYHYDQDVVVSDIDDTVVKTGAHQRVRMAVRYLTRDSPAVELVEPAAARFYRGLAARDVGLVFVTSRLSGWMPRTRREARRVGLPTAPILSKTRGSDSFKEHGDYKLRQIERVQSYLPHAKLHLIGDSGEADAEVFGTARKRWKNIASAHIRQVPGAESRDPLPRGVASFWTFGKLEIGRKPSAWRKALGIRAIRAKRSQLGHRIRGFAEARQQARTERARHRGKQSRARR